MTNPENPQSQRVENYNTSKDPYDVHHMSVRILVDLGYDIQFHDDATSASGYPLPDNWHMTVDSIDTRNKCWAVFSRLRKYETYGILGEVGDRHAYSLLSLLDPEEYSHFNDLRHSYEKKSNLSREVLESMYLTAFKRTSVKEQRILYRGKNRDKQRRVYNKLVQQGKQSYSADILKVMLHPAIEEILQEFPQLRPDAPPLPEDEDIAPEDILAIYDIPELPELSETDENPL